MTTLVKLRTEGFKYCDNMKATTKKSASNETSTPFEMSERDESNDASQLIVCSSFHDQRKDEAHHVEDNEVKEVSSNEASEDLVSALLQLKAPADVDIVSTKEAASQKASKAAQTKTKVVASPTKRSKRQDEKRKRKLGNAKLENSKTKAPSESRTSAAKNDIPSNQAPASGDPVNENHSEAAAFNLNAAGRSLIAMSLARTSGKISKDKKRKQPPGNATLASLKRKKLPTLKSSATPDDQRMGEISDAEETTTSSYSADYSKRVIVAPPAEPSQQDLNLQPNNRAREALKTWYKRLNEFYDFVQANGHGDVPQKYSENKPLGIWVNKQRMLRKAKEKGEKTFLTSKLIRTLDLAGFMWGKSRGDECWNERYTELLAFHSEKGHCNVPTKSRDNSVLGRWVSAQRYDYKQLKRGLDSPMTPERIRLLEEIGFEWERLGCTHTAKPSTDSADGVSESNAGKSGQSSNEQPQDRASKEAMGQNLSQTEISAVMGLSEISAAAVGVDNMPNVGLNEIMAVKGLQEINSTRSAASKDLAAAESLAKLQAPVKSTSVPIATNMPQSCSIAFVPIAPKMPSNREEAGNPESVQFLSSQKISIIDPNGQAMNANGSHDKLQEEQQKYEDCSHHLQGTDSATTRYMKSGLSSSLPGDDSDVVMNDAEHGESSNSQTDWNAMQMESVGRWSKEEHAKFLEGLEKFGKHWKPIAELIGTRTLIQVRTHAQKHCLKLARKNDDCFDDSVKKTGNTKQKTNRKSATPTIKSCSSEVIGKSKQVMKNAIATRENITQISSQENNSTAAPNDSHAGPMQKRGKNEKIPKHILLLDVCIGKAKENLSIKNERKTQAQTPSEGKQRPQHPSSEDGIAKDFRPLSTAMLNKSEDERQKNDSLQVGSEGLQNESGLPESSSQPDKAIGAHSLFKKEGKSSEFSKDNLSQQDKSTEKPDEDTSILATKEEMDVASEPNSEGREDNVNRKSIEDMASSQPNCGIAEDDSKRKENLGTWSIREHMVFLEGYRIHGKNWKLIAEMVGTRTKKQVQRHARRYLQELKIDDDGSVSEEEKPCIDKSILPSHWFHSPRPEEAITGSGNQPSTMRRSNLTRESLRKTKDIRRKVHQRHQRIVTRSEAKKHPPQLS